MGGHKKRSSDPGNSELMDALDRMEPELHHLEGILTVLRTFGEAQDSVEPIAIAALARSGGDALGVVTDAWHTAFEATRPPSAQ
jgi:hypothetical protein